MGLIERQNDVDEEEIPDDDFRDAQEVRSWSCYNARIALHHASMLAVHGMHVTLGHGDVFSHHTSVHANSAQCKCTMEVMCT